MLIQFIIVQLAIFALIVYVLRKLIVKDTTSAITRLKKIEMENRSRQEELNRKLLEADEEHKKKVAKTQEEIKHLKEEARKEVDSMKKNLLAQAKQDSDAIIGAAHANEENMRKKIYQELEIRAVDRAVKLLSLAFSGKTQSRLDEELTEEFLSNLEGLEKDHISSSVKKVVITSARSLSKSRRDEIEKKISKKIGRHVGIEEVVDKSLVAGLILKLDSLIIDGSLANYLKEAAMELKKEIEE